MIQSMGRIGRVVLAGSFAVSSALLQSCVPPPNPYASLQGSYQNGASVGTSPSVPSSASGGSTAPEARYHSPPAGSDADQSRALSTYLQHQRLPLVGAQVMTSGADRKVVLYGFVASDFGSQDAEAKARRFMGEPEVAIDNRIKVRPELLSSYGSFSGGYSSPNSSGSGAGSYANGPPGVGGVQAYQQNQEREAQAQVQQYVQQAPDPLTTLLPLIGMVGMMGLSYGSGGVGAFGYPGIPSFGSPGIPSYGYPGVPSYGYPSTYP